MLTFKELDELGAQLCASRVILNQEYVDGEVTEFGFEPAPGSILFKEAPKDEVKQFKAKAEPAPVEPQVHFKRK